jgi:hypothetical protein
MGKCELIWSAEDGWPKLVELSSEPALRRILAKKGHPFESGMPFVLDFLVFSLIRYPKGA